MVALPQCPINGAYLNHTGVALQGPPSFDVVSPGVGGGCVRAVLSKSAYGLRLFCNL